MQADIEEWKGKEVDRSEGGVTCQERGKREQEGKMGTQKKKRAKRDRWGVRWRRKYTPKERKLKGRQDGR